MVIKDYSQPFKYCVYEDIAKKNTKNTKTSIEGWITTHFRSQLERLLLLEKFNKL